MRRCSSCTASNPLAPTLRLAKTSVGGTGSFNFTLGGVNPGGENIITATAGTPVTSALHVGTAGTAATVTEAPAFGYKTATSCVDANAPGDGNVATPVTAATAVASLTAAQMRAGAAWTCSFTNTRLEADLSVTKLANQSSVQTGATVVYTVTVNNAGPDAANGAVLRDKVVGGLSCTATPTCVPSGGAVCPTATLTAAALASNAGVAIPTLPAGGSIQVKLACTVPASGQLP